MTLIREHISPNTDAPVMVIFGGNPHRMNEVVSMLKITFDNLTIIGNFSEEEGIEKLKQLKKVDLVLIGGRYSEEQRIRIRAFVKQHIPAAQTTEPGYDYAYDNAEILKDIRTKLNL